MMKKIIGSLVCMLLVVATVLPVAGNINEEVINKEQNVPTILNDFMKPSGNMRAPIEGNFDKSNLIPTYDRLSRGAPPEYEFITEPTTIMTSYYDYMPGSYSSHPIRRQTEHGDGYYLTFFGQESSVATRRQYWTYVGSDGTILDQGTITSYDEWQGYGDIGIHPATGNCIASWHENPGGGQYETAITFDDYDSGPGAWEDPVIVSSPGEMEYIWPTIQVGPSPVGEGYVRIYQTANNYHNLPSGNPCEDVRVMWIDVENTAEAYLSDLLDTDNWDYVTVMTDWRDKSCRPFQSFAIDYNNPGKVAFIGSCTWLEGDQGDMPVDEGAFVWESLDYGETWSYDNLHSDGPGSPLYYVDNPGHFPDAPSQLEVTISGWHNTALYDSEGNLHWTYLQAYGFTDPSGSYYFPYFMPEAEMVWDGSEFTFHEVPELPGIDPLSGHSVPWDEDNTYPVIAWSTYPSAGAGVFHENVQKQAINVEKNWMAHVWADGTYHQLGSDGDPNYVDYIEHPLIFISISLDNGNTWYDPIELTDIFSEEFDFSEQITVYPYVCDQIIDLGDGWGKIDMWYMDDNSFGSNVHGTGSNVGGQITYCSLKVKFSEPPPDPETEIGKVKGGFGKVSADVENIGTVNATDIDWSISVQGGILGLINRSTEGTIATLDTGETETVETDPVFQFIFGFGRINITIEATYAETWTGTGFVFGPFVLGVR